MTIDQRIEPPEQIDAKGQLAIPISVPAGFWEAELDHFPQPPSPAMRSLLPYVAAGTRNLPERFGLLLEGADYTTIGGWVYMRIAPLGGVDRPAPPPWLFRLLAKTVPALRSRSAAAVRALRDDEPRQLAGRWFATDRPALQTRIESLMVDRTALTDAELRRQVEAAVGLLADGSRVHFDLHGSVMVIVADLAFFCRDRLDFDDATTLELLAGTSFTSTRPADALADLAASAGVEVRRLIAAGEPVATVLAADAKWAAAFQVYRREFGTRALRYEPADPTLGEAPEVLLQLIGDRLAEESGAPADRPGADAAARALEAEARGRLDASSVAEFDRLLARARMAYPIREDNEFYTVSTPYGLVRQALLEVGARLVGRGQLGGVDEVFWLEVEEALAALADGSDRRPLVARRAAEDRWARAQRPPRSYGPEPGDPPSLDALPAAVRHVNEAFLWTLPRLKGAPPPDQPAATVSGLPVSPGRYTGPVRVIHDESQFGSIQRGDVLVCPITSPVWSVLFPSLGALVTDTGGLLSHPAIVAREFGLPAVVATGHATSLLRTGQIVTVDGSTGTVVVE